VSIAEKSHRDYFNFLPLFMLFEFSLFSFNCTTSTHPC
jgi:hypothetical protein